MNAERIRLVKGGVAYGYPVASLRTEARKGNLALLRVAGKDYVTPGAIREMERLCRKSPRERVSTCTDARAGNQSGSSETERGKSALAAANAISKALRKPCRNISRPVSGPTPGNVISLESGSRRS